MVTERAATIREQAMDSSAVLDEFRAAGALLEGHFILSSGLRSPRYLQCALVLSDPARAARLCSALAASLPKALHIDLVVSPAMGGVIVGYEMARALGVRSMFTERVDGQFTLRRGFEIPAGSRVLMMEDVVTTGLSSRECIECISRFGGEVVAAACLVDRSDGKADIGVPLYPLIRLDVPTYQPSALPPELAALPAVKPGSRSLA
jgi:orotate phosphoribosyltransferase